MKSEDMGALTEELRIKVTGDLHARLSAIATAKHCELQDVCRAYLDSGAADTWDEYTVAARFITANGIAAESRGKGGA